MLKYLFKILPLLFLLIIQGSCKKAIKRDPVSIITSESFWKTENDVTGGLRGMYVKLRDQSVWGLYVFGEARSDMLTSAAAGTLGLDAYYQNSLNPSSPGGQGVNDWSGLYSAVNMTNLVLKYAPKIKFSTDANKNSALAQAYTMRAYLYFVLVRTWGNVPIRLEPMEGLDPKAVNVAQSTPEQVFTQIKKDLDSALALYPDNNFPAGRSTWSKPAANALKAEVYLWTGKLLNGGTNDFNTALAAIDEIQQTDVQLLPNFPDVFSYDNKGNKEIIMAVHNEILESSDNQVYRNMYMHTSNLGKPLTDSARAFVGVVGRGQNVWRIAPEIQEQFIDDDSRKRATFYNAYLKSGAFYETLGVKFRGPVDNTGVRYFLDDFILYRYADVLLMKAEAENALALDPSDEINEVRQRAYGGNYPNHVFVSGSIEENDKAILKERLFEFAIEGKRWWDLIRFGKALEMVPSLNDQEYMLLFPISDAILSLEPLVKQNPGW